MDFFRTLLASAATIFITAASAHSFDLGVIHIGHPWARETVPGQPTAGAYLTLENRGGADRLLAVSTPAAASAEVHSMSMEGTTMRMRKLNALDLPPGKTVVLAPGGFHVMLFGLKAPLKNGDRIPLTLRFEKAGEVTVTVNVQANDAAQVEHADHAGMKH
ncbi:copper chaperone PCu(A)C [Uliginosibacterium sp. sgz301328]|uniref:copper chaperone PCu(A)C n=1 Tax=Uliginosibacterium sp. sgz301328 TaxID=3243764 RepID=UPI00359E40AB